MSATRRPEARRIVQGLRVALGCVGRELWGAMWDRHSAEGVASYNPLPNPSHEAGVDGDGPVFQQAFLWSG